MGVSSILKDMLYGTAGAIGARTLSSIAQGFIPSAFAGSQMADPILQAAIGATIIRWGGKKFLGQRQADTMMLGAFISAGLSAANIFLPNIQGQLTSIIRAPVAQPVAVAPVSQAMSDVYDVDMNASGFGGFADVEDVDTGMFNNY